MSEEPTHNELLCAPLSHKQEDTHQSSKARLKHGSVEVDTYIECSGARVAPEVKKRLAVTLCVIWAYDGAHKVLISATSWVRAQESGEGHNPRQGRVKRVPTRGPWSGTKGTCTLREVDARRASGLGREHTRKLLLFSFLLLRGSPRTYDTRSRRHYDTTQTCKRF